MSLGGVEEVVADKGYHSGPVLQDMQAGGVRTYIPEKKQAGKRHWVGKEEERDVVYANRQRLQRPKGKRLLRKRGELIERTFAHCYDTGGMRRTHLRKHNNILKRLLVHVAGMNLGLLLRSVYGIRSHPETRETPARPASRLTGRAIREAQGASPLPAPSLKPPAFCRTCGVPLESRSSYCGPCAAVFQREHRDSAVASVRQKPYR